MSNSRPLSIRQNERNQAATLWVGGGLDESVDEELIWELFSQVGPVVDVCMPKDKVTGQHQKYAFVEMRSELDAEYAMKVLNMIKLNGKSIRINRSSREQQDFDIGANLFVGNLDRDVDDQILYNTFSAFGQVLDVKTIADVDGTPRGFGFVSFASFEAADAALESMNGQYLCNLPMHVSYAYKKDGAHGERHGTAAERALAANRSAGIVSQSTQVHTQFSAGVEAPGGAAAAPALHLQPQLAAGYGYAAQPPPLPPSFSHVPAPAMMQMPPPPVFTAPPPPPPPAGFAMAGGMAPPPQFPPPPPPQTQTQAHEQAGIQPPPPPPGLQQPPPPPPPPVAH